jgi:hypothetical protein
MSEEWGYGGAIAPHFVRPPALLKKKERSLVILTSPQLRLVFCFAWFFASPGFLLRLLQRSGGGAFGPTRFFLLCSTPKRECSEAGGR